MKEFCDENKLRYDAVMLPEFKIVNIFGKYGVVSDHDRFDLSYDTFLPAVIETVALIKANVKTDGLSTISNSVDSFYRYPGFRQVELRYDSELRKQYSISTGNVSPASDYLRDLYEYWSMLHDLACGDYEYQEEMILASGEYEPFSEEKIEREKKLDILESIQGIADMLNLERVPDPTDPDFDVVVRNGVYMIVLEKNPDVLDVIADAAEVFSHIDRKIYGLDYPATHGKDLDNLEMYWLDVFAAFDDNPPSPVDIESLRTEYEEEMILSAGISNLSDKEKAIKETIMQIAGIIGDGPFRTCENVIGFDRYVGGFYEVVSLSTKCDKNSYILWLESEALKAGGIESDTSPYYHYHELISPPEGSSGPSGEAQYPIPLSMDFRKKNGIETWNYGSTVSKDLDKILDYWQTLLSFVEQRFYHEEEMILHSDSNDDNNNGGRQMPDETENVSVFPESGARSFLFSADDGRRKKLITIGLIALAGIIIIGVITNRKKTSK
jgi:hypothetical protein